MHRDKEAPAYDTSGRGTEDIRLIAAEVAQRNDEVWA
jgi:hypothetical protein